MELVVGRQSGYIEAREGSSSGSSASIQTGTTSPSPEEGRKDGRKEIEIEK